MKYRIGALLAVLVTSSFVFWRVQGTSNQQSEPQVLGVTAPTLVHTEYNFDWQSMYRAVAAQRANPGAQFQADIRGGVVPHHLVGAELIADFYSRAAAGNADITRVIVLGPNHQETGDFWALTSTGAWQAQQIQVQPDLHAITELQKAGVLRAAPSILEKEHSITSQIPFIAEYMPRAQVIPVILSARTTAAELDQLEEALVPLVNQDTLVVAAVDFSHNLPTTIAYQRDAETQKLMKANKYQALLRLAGNSEYLDSAASIVLLQRLMQLQQTELTVIEHTDSATLLQQKAQPTTTYFEIVFLK